MLNGLNTQEFFVGAYTYTHLKHQRMKINYKRGNVETMKMSSRGGLVKQFCDKRGGARWRKSGYIFRRL